MGRRPESRETMPKANIKIKPNDNGDWWCVETCSAYIDNKDLMYLRSGELFPTKDAGIMEMKHRVMAWLKDKGRTETEEKVEFRVS
jgi:hypothetical protein